MAKFLFFLKQGAVYCRITVDKEKCELSTGLKVEPAKWDTDKKRMKGNNPGAESVNKRLDAVLTKLRNIETDLVNRGLPYTPRTIKEIFEGKTKERCLLDVYRQYLDHLEEECAQGHLSPITVRNYLTRYQNTKTYVNTVLKLSDLRFVNVDEDFSDGLKRWCLKDMGFTLGYTGKHLEALKVIVKYAIRRRYTKENAVLSVAVPRENYASREIVYLNESQLAAIESFPAEGQLKECLDGCILQAHTGMAFREAYDMRPEWIYKGVDGGLWVEFYRQKTRKMKKHKVRVPLDDTVQRIIERYKSHPQVLFTGRCLPLPSNQQVNRHLKSVAAVLGLPAILSTHHFRKTAGMLWLNGGVGIEVVAALLGDTVEVTKIHYARIIEEKIARDLNNFNSRIKKAN